MPPKTTNRALRAAAEQTVPGKLDHRIESACDEVMDTALEALAGELGGQGARSKIIRDVVRKGLAVVLAERTAAA